MTGTHADRAHAQVPTASAAAFRDTVGVVANPTWMDTSYGQWSRVVATVRDLGVSHIRAPMTFTANADYNTTIYGHYRAAAAAGIRFNLLLPLTCSHDLRLEPCIRALRDEMPLGNVESVEWPNEHDISGDPNWRANLADWGQQIHAQMKGDPALRQIQVIGPVIVGAEARGQLGDQSPFMDRGNIHPYTGGLSPRPEHQASERLLASVVSAAKPLTATEAGFHTSLAHTNPDQPPTAEPAAAVYTVRTVLEHFAEGVGRTYIHQLLNPRDDPADSQANYGLLRHDFSPKPSFTALKNLLAMVGTSAPASVTPLAHSVAGDTGDLRRIVLQQGDGTHLLVLWRTASVWNLDTRQPLGVAPVRYTVSVPGATSYEAGDPLLSAGFLPGRLDGDRIAVDVGADPVLLRIRTPGGGVPAAPGTAGTPVPGAGSAPGGSAAALDTRRPRLSRLRVKRVARRYVAVFRLSEAARVGVRLDRGRAGSRARYRFLRRLAARPLRAGARSVTLGRKLKRGRHRVLLAATDAAGNEVRVAARFRVRARRR